MQNANFIDYCNIHVVRAIHASFRIAYFQDGVQDGIRHVLQIVSEYDQEIPQSQTADNPMAPRGRAAQPSRDTRKTN